MLFAFAIEYQAGYKPILVVTAFEITSHLITWFRAPRMDASVVRGKPLDGDSLNGPPPEVPVDAEQKRLVNPDGGPTLT